MFLGKHSKINSISQNHRQTQINEDWLPSYRQRPIAVFIWRSRCMVQSNNFLWKHQSMEQVKRCQHAITSGWRRKKQKTKTTREQSKNVYSKELIGEVVIVTIPLFVRYKLLKYNKCGCYNNNNYKKNKNNNNIKNISQITKWITLYVSNCAHLQWILTCNCI